MHTFLTDMCIAVACVLILAVLVRCFLPGLLAEHDGKHVRGQSLDIETWPVDGDDHLVRAFTDVGIDVARTLPNGIAPIRPGLSLGYQMNMRTGTGIEYYRELANLDRSWQREQAARGLARWQETGEYDESEPALTRPMLTLVPPRPVVSPEVRSRRAAQRRLAYQLQHGRNPLGGKYRAIVQRASNREKVAA